MKVSIVGAGYVGLVTGGCLADLGHQVMCIDSDAGKVATLNAAGLPIYEPGLQELMARNRAEGRIQFTTDMALAVEHAEVIFIAVGTPSKEDGSADLQHVLAVASQIGRHLKSFKVIVNKSTVPVGTAYRVQSCLQAELNKRGIQDPLFEVISNPEFLKSKTLCNQIASSLGWTKVPTTTKYIKKWSSCIRVSTDITRAPFGWMFAVQS